LNARTPLSAFILLASLSAFSQTAPPADVSRPLTLSGAPLGVAWSFLYGSYGVPTERFLPKIRALGGGFSKVYLLWSQIEPTKSKYDWTAVDAYVKQLKSPDEGLISIFSSSTWATKKPSAVLPPSPAKNPDDYYRFIFDTVKHCKGKVRYWQNDSEPNNPIYWSGTKEEFVAQLKVFAKAVRDADPEAKVVCGGYDGLFNPPGMPAMPSQQSGLAFFDYVLQNGSDAFDLFDLRLYANPYTIGDRVAYIRSRMAAFGYDRPIICTEYGGPGFFEFLENRKYVGLVVSWSQSLATAGPNGEMNPDSAGPKKIDELYKGMSALAPQTQMFMQDCAPELQMKFERIQARDLVMRNLFALAAGVQKTLYWDLWNDASDRNNLMTLMYGKIPMMSYVDKELTKVNPVGDVFRRLTAHLRRVRQVRQIALPNMPTVCLFEVDRAGQAPLYAVWDRRDVFNGENQPATFFEWHWNARHAKAEDVFGIPTPAEVSAGKIRMLLSSTPIFIEPSR